MYNRFRCPSATVLAALMSLAWLGPVAPAGAKELKLAYFMGSRHPMNAAVFEPFATRLAQLSGGRLTVKTYPGGALNSSPPRQYAMLLDGVADIAFGLPGYTGQLFPITNAVSVPGVAESAVEATEKLWNAMRLVEKEYDAKLLALWANGPKVLITRNRPVKRLEDLAGLKVRVTSRQDVPFFSALGAGTVAQPVTVINRNLANGTIDAIAIDPSAIVSFKLWEPANFITTNLPPSTAAFFLLMNRDTWNALSAQEKAWVDAASGRELSLKGARAYARSSARGLALARENGVEVFELPKLERQRFMQAMRGEITAFRSTTLRGGVTGAEVLNAFEGR